jgi:hypothetical protein
MGYKVEVRRATVRGTPAALFTIGFDDEAIGNADFVHVKDVLLVALKSSGVGGKGSSGYGRLVEVVRR